MLKMELRRAVLSKIFLLAILVNLGMLAIGGCDYLIEFLQGFCSQGTYLEKFLMSYGYGLTSLLAIFFPIAAVLPYSLSYRRERDSGYRQLLILKSSVKSYRWGKLLSVACSAFLSFFVPCFVWLIVCCFILRTGDTHIPIIYGIDFAPNLYKTRPFLYGMIYVCNAGLQGAVFAILGMGLSAVISNRYLAALLPFCYCIFTASIADMFNRAWNALALFVPGQYHNKAVGHWGILIYDAFLLIAGIGLFLGGDKYAQNA